MAAHPPSVSADPPYEQTKQQLGCKWCPFVLPLQTHNSLGTEMGLAVQVLMPARDRLQTDVWIGPLIPVLDSRMVTELPGVKGSWGSPSATDDDLCPGNPSKAVHRPTPPGARGGCFLVHRDVSVC